MHTSTYAGPGTTPPRQFFMTLRDIAFWIRSAQADAHLKRLRRAHGNDRAIDLLYQELKDPWCSNVSYYRYQQLKYQILVSLLPARRYRRVLDLGCGLGGLTRELARYADCVLGVDLSASAIAQARNLSGGYGNVHFEQADVLDLRPDWKDGFDLAVIADTLYYLSPLTDNVLKRVRQSITDLLAAGGVMMLANHFFTDFDRESRVSRDIHEAFRWGPGLKLLREHRKPFYLASILERE